MNKYILPILLLFLIVTGSFNTANSQTFTEQTGVSFTGIRVSNIAWGDYDNDGDLDILISGLDASSKRIIKVYQNKGNGIFIEQTSIILPASWAQVSWGDYNNDGFLDILISGETQETCIV